MRSYIWKVVLDWFVVTDSYNVYISKRCIPSRAVTDSLADWMYAWHWGEIYTASWINVLLKCWFYHMGITGWSMIMRLARWSFTGSCWTYGLGQWLSWCRIQISSTIYLTATFVINISSALCSYVEEGNKGSKMPPNRKHNGLSANLLVVRFSLSPLYVRPDSGLTFYSLALKAFYICWLEWCYLAYPYLAILGHPDKMAFVSNIAKKCIGDLAFSALLIIDRLSVTNWNTPVLFLKKKYW